MNLNQEISFLTGTYKLRNQHINLWVSLQTSRERKKMAGSLQLLELLVVLRKHLKLVGVFYKKA